MELILLIVYFALGYWATKTNAFSIPQFTKLKNHIFIFFLQIYLWYGLFLYKVDLL